MWFEGPMMKPPYWSKAGLALVYSREQSPEPWESNVCHLDLHMMGVHTRLGWGGGWRCLIRKLCSVAPGKASVFSVSPLGPVPVRCWSSTKMWKGDGKGGREDLTSATKPPLKVPRSFPLPPHSTALTVNSPAAVDTVSSTGQPARCQWLPWWPCSPWWKWRSKGLLLLMFQAASLAAWSLLSYTCPLGSEFYLSWWDVLLSTCPCTVKV